MISVFPSKTLTISIACKPEKVYTFMRHPANLPQWAPAFSRSVRQAGDDWIVETTAGPMKIRFVEHNAFGVLDHVVGPVDGEQNLNPVRVIANGDGSEVMFTMFQRPDTSDEKFAEDAFMVDRDLQTLKAVLERPMSA